ncbi:MAG TPA: CAP domain-containing protein [Nitrososphaerales archaeon]|nr:CAP domain-containing protein [Nitrososphaerales archaeon]
MRISTYARRSFPTEEAPGSQPPPRSHRAAGLIVAALVLLAAFVFTAPYLSSVLKQSYSFLSGSSVTGPSTVTSMPSNATSSATTASTETNAQCSGVVSVESLVAPDIQNGSADIAYPSDYCTLASYALGLINQDRGANGTGPVTLDYNQAAQQHADSMLYYGYFSHFDTQGYKPYMRYSLLGGRGADFENVAYYYFSVPHFVSTDSVETAVKELEYSMVYNDSSCCDNGHRYNILDPLHNQVSIGVAYNSTTVYFDEEFENNYINLNFTVAPASASDPYYVTLEGVPTGSFPSPNSLYVAFDTSPAAMTPGQLNSGPHEYGPGSLVGGVLPRVGFFGDCGQFTSGTTVCADTWEVTSNTVEIAFPLDPFIREYGPGVYTLYLITGSSTDSAVTSLCVFVS